ncbi:MAG: hypothetical protein K2H96_01580, partial [Muribaculaceae bacterium]|nr:hypothetical protein [Muribaculaceae bacterium]
EGFEPPEVLPSTVFKTAAIDHSAISPYKLVLSDFAVSSSFALQSYTFFSVLPNLFLLFWFF